MKRFSLWLGIAAVVAVFASLMVAQAVGADEAGPAWSAAGNSRTVVGGAWGVSGTASQTVSQDGSWWQAFAVTAQ